MSEEPRPPERPAAPDPGLPLPGLGRTRLSARGRTWVAVALGAALVVAVVAGGVLAVRSGEGPRTVTLPLADRNASPELLREARATGYRPPHAAGVGEVEDDPAGAGRPPSSKNLLPVGEQAP